MIQNRRAKALSLSVTAQAVHGKSSPIEFVSAPTA
jgi:hypothetical protein